MAGLFRNSIARWLSASLLLIVAIGATGVAYYFVARNKKIELDPSTREDRIVKTDEEWRQILTPEQFRVTREHGTERPFANEYWDCKKQGVYKCVCCGLPLFDSETKYDSQSGWPSFYDPVKQANVGKQVDKSIPFMERVEVHCARCQAHLGHVFEDGPQPTNLRYCINSVSIKLEPRDSGVAERDNDKRDE